MTHDTLRHEAFYKALAALFEEYPLPDKCPIGLPDRAYRTSILRKARNGGYSPSSGDHGDVRYWREHMGYIASSLHVPADRITAIHTLIYPDLTPGGNQP